jgi:N-acetylmuramic acid 6-phosphate etherase
MKSGTAQKLILNMISTASMIGLGRISDNKMVDMQLTNEKLIERGVRMIMKETNLEKSSALELLKSTNSVRLALEKFRSGKHKN